MWRLRLQLVAIKGTSMLLFDESFYGDKKEAVVDKASKFIISIVKGGYTIIKQHIDYSFLGN